MQHNIVYKFRKSKDLVNKIGNACFNLLIRVNHSFFYNKDITCYTTGVFKGGLEYAL